MTQFIFNLFSMSVICINLYIRSYQYIREQSLKKKEKKVFLRRTFSRSEKMSENTMMNGNSDSFDYNNLRKYVSYQDSMRLQLRVFPSLFSEFRPCPKQKGNKRSMRFQDLHSITVTVPVQAYHLGKRPRSEIDGPST